MSSINKNKTIDVWGVDTFAKEIMEYSSIEFVLFYLWFPGLQVTFWQGVYSPSLGFTLAFGDSVKELVGLSGIFMSFGGVIGEIST